MCFSPKQQEDRAVNRDVRDDGQISWLSDFDRIAPITHAQANHAASCKYEN